jgi:hypothetical protein
MAPFNFQEKAKDPQHLGLKFLIVVSFLKMSKVFLRMKKLPSLESTVQGNC